MERQALIARKSKDLSRGCGYLIDRAEEIHDDHDDQQYDRRCFRCSDSVDNCDPWLAARIAQILVDVAH